MATQTGAGAISGVEGLLAHLAQIRTSVHGILEARAQPHLRTQVAAANTSAATLQQLASLLPARTPAEAAVLSDASAGVRALRQELLAAEERARRVEAQAALLGNELAKQSSTAFPPAQPPAKVRRTDDEPWSSARLETELQKQTAALPGLHMELCEPGGGTDVVRFRLQNVMHGYVLVRHLVDRPVIERVVVRGLLEPLDQTHPWTSSMLGGFRRISTYATSAALYFSEHHAADAIPKYAVSLAGSAEQMRDLRKKKNRMWLEQRKREEKKKG